MAKRQAAPIDPSVSRECIYQEFEGEPGPCPRCGGAFHQQSELYAIATRRGRRVTDTFLISGDFGWYCEECPTLVINPTRVGEMLSFSKPDWDTGDAFAVLGLVDLGAIPEEKSHLLLGDDDNPIPLVEFTRVSGRPGAHPGQETALETARYQALQVKASDKEAPSLRRNERFPGFRLLEPVALPPASWGGERVLWGPLRHRSYRSVVQPTMVGTVPSALRPRIGRQRRSPPVCRPGCRGLGASTYPPPGPRSARSGWRTSRFHFSPACRRVSTCRWSTPPQKAMPAPVGALEPWPRPSPVR